MIAIQYASLFVGAIGLLKLASLISCGRRPWWFVAPGIVLLEIVLFYLVVWLGGGFGSNDANASISATIRFQVVALFTMYLFIDRE